MRFAVNIAFIALATLALQQLVTMLRSRPASISVLWTVLAFFLAALMLVVLALERTRARAALRASEAALRGSHARVHDLAARLITAQEAERTRIARELHDGVNQKLAGISIALSDLRRHPQRHREGWRAELARIQAAVNEVNTDLRQLSHELHPGVLRHAGLVAALRSACSDLSRLHGAAITFTAEQPIGSLPDDISLCLYRVTQEALQNVAAHSGARSAEVSLSRDGDEIELTVTDDGRGFDTSDLRRRSGLGLISIHERVQLVHGTVHIDAHPRHGTMLRVRVPIPSVQLAGAHEQPDALSRLNGGILGAR